MEKLVNNGLPTGIHFKDIKPGAYVIVTPWVNEGPAIQAIVLESYMVNRRREYKGMVEYRVFDSHNGQRIVHGGLIQELVAPSVWTCLRETENEHRR